MSIEALAELVSQRLGEDEECFWTIETEPPEHALVRFALNPDFSNLAVLDFGSDAFCLQLGEDYLVMEFEYTEAEQRDVLLTQLGRGLDYLHGRCAETEELRDGVRLSKTITFPDGTETTYLWVSPWQRFWWRLTGRRPRNRLGPTPYSYTQHPPDNEADR